MPDERLVIELEDKTPPPRDLRPNADLDEAFGVAPPAADPFRRTLPPLMPTADEVRRMRGTDIPAPEPAAPRGPPPGGPVPADALGKSGREPADRLDPAAKGIEDVLDRLRRGLLTTSEAFDRFGQLAKSQRTTDYLREQGLAKPGGELQALQRLAQNAGGAQVARPAAVQPADLVRVAKVAEPEAEAPGLLSQLGPLLSRLPGGAGRLAGLAGQALGGGEAAAAAGGAGAAGGLGGLAAVAGPVGIAFAAAQIGSQKLADGFKDIQKDIHLAGDAAKAVAGNSGLGLLNAASEKAADTLENRLPIAGKVYAEAIRTATAGINELAAVVNALTDRGRQLSAYNADLARTTAQADVRRLQADIREANRTGAQLSRLIDAQSRTETAIQDAFAPVKALLAEKLSDILEKVAAIAEAVGPVIELMTEGVKIHLDTMSRAARQMGGILTPVAVRLGELAEEAKQSRLDRLAKEGTPALAALLALADRVRLAPEVPPDPRGMDRNLAVPLLNQ